MDAIKSKVERLKDDVVEAARKQVRGNRPLWILRDAVSHLEYAEEEARYVKNLQCIGGPKDGEFFAIDTRHKTYLDVAIIPNYASIRAENPTAPPGQPIVARYFLGYHRQRGEALVFEGLDGWVVR